MTEAEEKIVHQILKYGSVEVHHKDSLKWKRREKLREMEERGILEFRSASSGGLYLSYGPGRQFYNFLEENNIQTFDFQKHQEEKDRKRMEQYNDPEYGKRLKERAKEMRDKVKIIFKY